MADQISNDNVAAVSAITLPVPDAHGQAALLLVESLIHGLISRSVIDVAAAIEIVAIAADVKVEVAADMGDTPVSLERSLVLLSAIGKSLSNDLTDE